MTRPWRPALWAALLLLCGRGGSAQKLREYNLWVCPHCEKGVKVADVSDLTCEADPVEASGIDWAWVKQAIYRFLHDVRGQDNPNRIEEMHKLIDIAQAPAHGECYLGIISLGYFSFWFMDPTEKRNFIKETMFGGVPFKRTVPLSYWDVLASGWPIFGLLAAAATSAQEDLAEMMKRTVGEGEPEVGLTGINLGRRECCDFPGGGANEDDRSFLEALSRSLEGRGWQGPALPGLLPLEYLAQSAHRVCSWGRATAYFALAEGLLGAPGGLTPGTWNSSQTLLQLGEHNLNGCEDNITVFHQWQSVWPFWQVLARMELKRVGMGGPLPEAPSADGAAKASVSPPAPPSAVRLKWQHLMRSRGASESGIAADAVATAAAVPPPPAAAAPSSAAACLDGAAGAAHVALSADLGQLDGLIVTLNSGLRNAASNASRLCFHAFALPHQRSFVIEGLQCAFGGNMMRTPLGDAEGPQAFLLFGTARLLLHNLNASYVWNEVGLPSVESGRSNNILLDGVDIREALRSDTGNLGAVHNFARFVLHDLLPGLPRVIYLDVDIVVRGDLTQLYDAPLFKETGSEGTIAAVRRMHQPLRVYVDVLNPAVPAWLPSQAPSFNAGVLVIDLKRWRERSCVRLVAEWIKENARKTLWLHGSQPPLLLLFHDEVVPLDWTWNIDGLGHRLNYPKNVLREANILHWTGPLKPWRNHGVNRLLWEPYTLEYCQRYSVREHTTTCRPDSWFC